MIYSLIAAAFYLCQLFWYTDSSVRVKIGFGTTLLPLMKVHAVVHFATHASTELHAPRYQLACKFWFLTLELIQKLHCSKAAKGPALQILHKPARPSTTRQICRAVQQRAVSLPRAVTHGDSPSSSNIAFRFNQDRHDNAAEILIYILSGREPQLIITIILSSILLFHQT